MASRTPTRWPTATSRRPHDRPCIVLDDRVAALERGGRAEHAQPVAGVHERASASRSSRSAGSRRSEARRAVERVRRVVIQLRGRRKRGGPPAAGDPPGVAAPPSSARPARASSASSSAAGGVVGHDQLCRQARRAGADVGDKVDNGVSCSWPMAETTGVRHSATARHRPLVGERQQILDAAAAAGEHDHVDHGVGVELRSAAAIRPRAPAPWTTASAIRNRGPAGGGPRPSRRRRAWRPRRCRTRARRRAAGTAGGACARPRTGPRRQPQAHLLDPAQQLSQPELLDREARKPELALRLPQLAAAEHVHAVAGRRRWLDAGRTVRAASWPAASPSRP